MPTANATVTPPMSAAATARASELLQAHQTAIWTRTDRLFAGLLACEWLAGVILASVMTPRVWDGTESRIHPHVWAALLLGACVVTLPIFMAFLMPARALTRQVIAVGQMLMSALLIHFGGGRIEMHFHVFGSLAFLAFYRDWRVLITASLVVSLDHLARGLYAPASVFATLNTSVWRIVEHAGWVIFEDIFLLAACVQAVREMRGIATNRALLEESYRDVEAKVIERTQQLKAAQDDLVRTAHTAGMAEIATSVLHNVGNVLNSVNVSANVVAEKLKQSEVSTLAQVSQLITENKPNLGEFMSKDERGQMIPDFIAELAKCLGQEQQTLLDEVASLTKGIDHIKHIVAAQQSMAKKKDCRTSVEPATLFDTAMKLQSKLASRSITIHREIVATGSIEVDEHKVLQVLVNLLGNAYQAVTAKKSGPQEITLGAAREMKDGVEHVRFWVSDTGVGISAENLSKMFRHGFTTKKDGHGFGLHASANAAREMGGSLSVASDGVGTGATFTLEFPLVSTPMSTEVASGREAA